MGKTLKFTENRFQNKPYKAHHKLFFMFCLLLVTSILCVNSVSAVWWNGLDTNLSAYWRFDEISGNATDEISARKLWVNNSGNGLYVEGLINNSYRCAIDSGNGGGNTTVMVNPNAYSVNFWVNWTGDLPTTVQMIINPNWQFGWFGADFKFYYAGESCSNMPFKANNMTMLTFTMNTTNQYFYLNSTLLCQINVTGTLNATPVNIFGNDAGGQGHTSQYDEMAIWNDRMLTQTEIDLLYNNGLGETYNVTGSAIAELSNTYNATTYETSKENFTISILYNSTAYTNIEGNLIYNGTSYLGVRSLSGDSAIISKSIEVPTFVSSGSFNYSFYWEFALTNETGQITYVNSSFQNQTINHIKLTLCNATYPVPYVNFTFEDELLGIPANGTFSTDFTIWLTGSSGDNYVNYSFQNLTENTNYAFCFSPNETSINVNMNAQYSGSGYSDRTYYLNNATLTNSTNNITLYQLNDSDAVKFFVDVLQGIDSFAGATITISKFFVGEGIYKTTGIRTTDDAGEFVEYLELDQDYRFAITRDGVNYGVIDKTSTCAEAPCELTLKVDIDTSNLWEGFDDYYAGNVEYTFRYNESSKLASLIFIDSTGLAQYVRLEINEVNTMNSTVYNVCNTTLYSSSGTITCDMTGQAGDFIARAYISRSPEKFINAWSFFINSIKDILGLDGLLISMFIIITIALVGAWSPTAGIVLTSFAILIMKLIGFVAFGWTTVTLLLIIAIILVMKVKQ